MNDWTLKKYRSLCQTMLKTGYKIQTVYDYIKAPAEQTIIIRHDVDRFPMNALKMAQLENELGIKATYYLRKTPSIFSSDFVKNLHSLGHEVGYHYEVLTKAKGDIKMALVLFCQELAAFRQIVPVYTAAAHGNPLFPWNNQSIWENINATEFQLVGEPYFQIDYNQVAYYTDTGRSWDSTKTNFYDKPTSKGNFVSIHTTDDLIDLIKQEHYKRLCIQTHPERWSSNYLNHSRSALMDFGTNTVKRLIRILR